MRLGSGKHLEPLTNFRFGSEAGEMVAGGHDSRTAMAGQPEIEDKWRACLGGVKSSLCCRADSNASKAVAAFQREPWISDW